MRLVLLGLAMLVSLACAAPATTGSVTVTPHVPALAPTATAVPTQSYTLALPDDPPLSTITPEPEATPTPGPDPTAEAAAPPDATGGAATGAVEILPRFPITQRHMRAFVDYYVALYGGSSAEIWGILMLESGAQPYPVCGDNGASCGPAQIQRGFYAGFQQAFGHMRQFQRPYSDLITDPEYSVEVLTFAVRQGWGPRWSGWWVYHGMRPPWW